MANSWIIHKSAQWPALFRFLQAVDIPKCGLEVVWRRPKRTNQQNKYLWGVVYKTLADGLSEIHNAHITPDQIHRLCRQYFMPKEDIPGLNKTVDMSTTQLCRSGNEDSFQDYVTQIQQLAAERGIYIPDPNEPPRE